MFKLNTVDLTKKSINHNVCKIRALISKAVSDLDIANKELPQLQQSPLKKRAQSNTEPQSIQQIFQNLRRGRLVQKHSRNTKKPHAKYVYLSSDHKWLCWKSLDREDEKKFELSTIVKVVKEGYKNYIKDDLSLKNPNCCLLIVSTVRNLQIQTASEFQADLFKYQLSRVLSYSKEMSQNYLYHKK